MEKSEEQDGQRRPQRPSDPASYVGSAVKGGVAASSGAKAQRLTNSQM